MLRLHGARLPQVRLRPLKGTALQLAVGRDAVLMRGGLDAVNGHRAGQKGSRGRGAGAQQGGSSCRDIIYYCYY